jgi:hypothetical protein
VLAALVQALIEHCLAFICTAQLHCVELHLWVTTLRALLFHCSSLQVLLLSLYRRPNSDTADAEGARVRCTQVQCDFYLCMHIGKAVSSCKTYKCSVCEVITFCCNSSTHCGRALAALSVVTSMLPKPADQRNVSIAIQSRAM